uniref:(northern house mosquito) hypothetical protein n=1 Tax=Culex pipiens TaxID=7175 RepID=A0A8D8ITC0_CULPI
MDRNRQPDVPRARTNQVPTALRPPAGRSALPQALRHRHHLKPPRNRPLSAGAQAASRTGPDRVLQRPSLLDPILADVPARASRLRLVRPVPRRKHQTVLQRRPQQSIAERVSQADRPDQGIFLLHPQAERDEHRGSPSDVRRTQRRGRSPRGKAPASVPAVQRSVCAVHGGTCPRGGRS